MTPDSAANPPIELSLRAQEIVAAARELLEEEGAVSMRRLADRLGIKAPSLYKHLPGKQALEAALISDAFLEPPSASSRRPTSAHSAPPTAPSRSSTPTCTG